MAKYLKPQTPLQHQNGDYIYPLTTSDQVIIDKDNRLNSLFKKTIKEIATCKVAGWSDTKPYAQTIILNHSVDDYDVDANVAYGDEDNAALHAAAGCLSYIKKNNNTITFYCLKKKPDIDIPVEISGTCRNTIADITIEEGIDTSDANATANDILSGKTAYVKGEKITGNYEGIELNFKVVGGTTEPTNPTENMIWVNTDVEITGYKFSAIEPENIIEGEVWFLTGVTSPCEFDALKNNDLTVYPISAKQMVSGTLKDVTVKTYQDGKWVSWNTYLYNVGNEFSELTGGWVSKAWSHDSSGVAVSPTIKKNSSTMVASIASATGYRDGAIITANDIDLTTFTKLVLKIQNAQSEGMYSGVSLRIGNRNTQYINAVASAGIVSGTSSVGSKTITMDVSKITGMYAIYFTFQCRNDVTYNPASGSVTISSIELS